MIRHILRTVREGGAASAGRLFGKHNSGSAVSDDEFLNAALVLDDYEGGHGHGHGHGHDHDKKDEHAHNPHDD